MGTILSLCPYDAAAREALQSAKLRRPAISRYASWAVFPISRVVRNQQQATRYLPQSELASELLSEFIDERG
jgi:hypothetical protein